LTTFRLQTERDRERWRRLRKIKRGENGSVRESEGEREIDR
jgi:hypothetical protein